MPILSGLRLTEAQAEVVLMCIASDLGSFPDVDVPWSKAERQLLEAAAAKIEGALQRAKRGV